MEASRKADLPSPRWGGVDDGPDRHQQAGARVRRVRPQRRARCRRSAAEEASVARVTCRVGIDGLPGGAPAWRRLLADRRAVRSTREHRAPSSAPTCHCLTSRYRCCTEAGNARPVVIRVGPSRGRPPTSCARPTSAAASAFAQFQHIHRTWADRQWPCWYPAPARRRGDRRRAGTPSGRTTRWSIYEPPRIGDRRRRSTPKTFRLVFTIPPTGRSTRRRRSPPRRRPWPVQPPTRNGADRVQRRAAQAGRIASAWMRCWRRSLPAFVRRSTRSCGASTSCLPACGIGMFILRRCCCGTARPAR